MQNSGAIASSLISALGSEPVAASGGRAPLAGEERDGAGDDAFAALLASLDVPVGGEALPPGGNVLPLDPAASSHMDGDAQRAARALPAPSSAAGTASDARGTVVRVTDSGSFPTSGLSASLLAADARLDPALGAGTGPDVFDSATPAEPRLAQQVSPASADPLVDTAGDAADRTALRFSAPTADLQADAPQPSTLAADLARSSPSSADAPPSRSAADVDRHAELGALAYSADDVSGRVAIGLADAPTEQSAERSGAVRDAASRIAALAQTEEPGASSSPPALQSGIAAPAAARAEPSFGVDAAPAARAAPDADAGARPAPGDIGESVASRIRIMVDQGAGEARLRLNPPELGSIDVRISVVDDKTFVQLTASHAAGRDALEQSLPRLRELLAAGGLDVGGASVDGGRGGESSHAQSGGGAYAALDDAVDDRGASPVATPRSASPPAGRVDLYA